MPQNRIWAALDLFTRLSSSKVDMLLHILAVGSEGALFRLFAGGSDVFKTI